MLNEDDFADNLRAIDRPATWLNLDEFVQAVLKSYRRDKWQNQPDYVEIWSEKDALRNVISRITYEYEVPLMISRGQTSRTAIYEAYARFSEKIDLGKDCFLYYLGDHDPSGLSIYQSLKERISTYGRYGNIISFERPALTMEQIHNYKLPSDPAKESDPNYKKFVTEHGDHAVELDALPPDALQSLVREIIDYHVDPEIFTQAQKTEELDILDLQILLKA